jgi:hypothetical protein
MSDDRCVEVRARKEKLEARRESHDPLLCDWSRWYGDPSCKASRCVVLPSRAAVDGCELDGANLCRTS